MSRKIFNSTGIKRSQILSLIDLRLKERADKKRMRQGKRDKKLKVRLGVKEGENYHLLQLKLLNNNLLIRKSGVIMRTSDGL